MNFEFRSTTLAGVAEQRERWKRTVGSINFAMGQAIGRVYVARYFPPEAKAQIDDLVAHMRIALKERIARLDWMSPQTKVKALDKMARLNVTLESRSVRSAPTLHRARTETRSLRNAAIVPDTRETVGAAPLLRKCAIA